MTLRFAAGDQPVSLRKIISTLRSINPLIATKGKV